MYFARSRDERQMYKTFQGVRERREDGGGKESLIESLISQFFDVQFSKQKGVEELVMQNKNGYG